MIILALFTTSLMAFAEVPSDQINLKNIHSVNPNLIREKHLKDLTNLKHEKEQEQLKEYDKLKKQEQMRMPSVPPPPLRYEAPLPVCTKGDLHPKCRKFAIDEMGTTVRGVRTEEYDD